MSKTADILIEDILAEVVANENDAAWVAWTRDRLRLQGQLHELREQRNRLAARLLHRGDEPAGGKESRKLSRSEKRLAMGRGALLPLPQAAALLPLKDSEGRGWLRDRGLVLDLDGREVVEWGQVLDALTESPDDDAPTPVRRPSTTRQPLPRVPLGCRNRRR